jgi:hypothetical protein
MSQVQHFTPTTPKTPVWGHVSARAPVKGGTCKVIVCDHCEKEFAGGSLRITEHYAKCKSVPAKVKEWAVEELGRSAVKRQGKGAVKLMQGMFDDIAKESDQAPRARRSSRRHSTRTAVPRSCATRPSRTSFMAICAHSTPPQSKDTAVQQTRHCCSMVICIGGGESFLIKLTRFAC